VCLEQFPSMLNIHDVSCQLELLLCSCEILSRLHHYTARYSILRSICGELLRHMNSPETRAIFGSYTLADVHMHVLQQLEEFEEVQGDLMVNELIEHTCIRANLMKQSNVGEWLLLFERALRRANQVH
jgi:hypothetical protein